MPNKRGSPLHVPDRGDPHRKRVLGVLAQRRYRDKIRNQGTKRKGRADQGPKTQARTMSEATLTGDSNSALPHTFEMEHFSTALEESLTYPLTMPGSDSSLDLGCDPSDELQFFETSFFTFPDDRSLEMPVLKIMRAGLTVANALDCADAIWNPKSSHVINVNVLESSLLPRVFQPVEAQLLIPHHPLLDIFPWPTVRQRLIHVFAAPLNLRPPIARDPLAIAYMLYDIDDESEGFRIDGEDGLDQSAWVVGQKFFANWWWALDRNIVDRSNASRLARGQQRLSIVAPMPGS